MKKGLLLFFVVVLCGLQAAAQNFSVSGKVTYADDGSPVIGATVVVKGMPSVGSITDVNGVYKIAIPASAAEKVLVCKYVGLADQEKAVSSNGQVVDFAMVTDAKDIDGVVVTAYGATTQKAFTGSASVVRADEIKNLQITTPTQALQGLSTGVYAVGSMGQPGDSPKIRIRGIGTFVDGGGDPLIVVDGSIYNGNLNSISPSDIESLTVLKDANSTALYGSRAANGVIQITTKSGRTGKARISAQARYGFSDRAMPEFSYVGAAEYTQMMWQSLYNTAFYETSTSKGNGAASGKRASNDLIPTLVYNPYSTGQVSPIGPDGMMIDGARLLVDQNWQDVLFQTGLRQQYDFQVAGGSEAIRYLVSANMLNESGIMRNSNFERYGARGKIDAKATKWLEVGLNASVSYSKQNVPNQESTIGNSAVYFSRAVANIYPAYQMNQDGSYVQDAFGGLIPDFGGAGSKHLGLDGKSRPVLPDTSPLGTSLYDNRGSNRFLSSTIGYLQASFLKYFKLRTQASVDFSHREGFVYWNPLYGQGASTKGNSEKYRELSSTVIWTNTLTYDQTIQDDHHINAMIGMESEMYEFNYLYASRTGFDFMGQDELNYGSTVQSANSYARSYRNMRYMARANYDYADRYHFSASLSYDGSSRFAQGNRWGLFYSVGAAWNIVNESFWTNAGVSEWFSNFKLRASYGTSGNQDLGAGVYFPYMSTYSAGWDMPGYGGSIVGRLGNQNLRWEKQHMLDIGLDFGFLDNAITFSAGFYDRTSQDLLMSRPLALSSGITSIYDNIGQIRNTGFEFELSATPFNTQNVYWNIGVNVSTQSNKVLQLPESANATNGMSNPGSTGKWLREGYSSYTWYLREWAGVDPADGRPMWWKYDVDAQGNMLDTRTTTKTISEAQQRLVAEGLPKVMGGVNTNLRVYGVELGIVCSFALGHKVYNSDRAMLMHGFNSSNNGHQTITEARTAWKQPGDITDVPMLGRTNYNFTSASTRWLVSGDYFRVRNITLGYDFAQLKGVKTFGMQNLRLYASVENPFTIFGAEGIDPEQGLAGSTNNYSSALRTFSIGLNLTF